MKRELHAVVLHRKVCFAQKVVVILLLGGICEMKIWPLREGEHCKAIKLILPPCLTHGQGQLGTKQLNL